MRTSLDNIKEKILAIQELPTLPTIAMEVSALTHDPNSSMRDIVAVIQNDPAITGKILKIANSAFYGMRQRIDSVTRALVILGTNEINNLVTSIAVFDAFPISPQTKVFNRRIFWEHCILTGEIAKSISLKLNMNVIGEIFTAGLLHDIGKIILDQYFHEDFMEACKMSEKDGIHLYAAEKQIFQVTHSQIGGWLSEKWKLPKKIIDVIYYHHKPLRSLNYKSFTSIINIANYLAKIASGTLHENDLKTYITESIAWQILEREIPVVSRLDLEEFIDELAKLTENAKEFMSVVI